MKRYIRSNFDLTRFVVNGDWTEEDEITIYNAIVGMCEQAIDNYGDERRVRRNPDLLVDIVIEHLDDPDLYGLHCGQDYSREQVEEILWNQFEE